MPKKLGPIRKLHRRVETLISEEMCVRDKLRLGRNLEVQWSPCRPNRVLICFVALFLVFPFPFVESELHPLLHGLIEWVNVPFEAFYCYDAVERW